MFDFDDLDRQVAAAATPTEGRAATCRQKRHGMGSDPATTTLAQGEEALGVSDAGREAAAHDIDVIGDGELRDVLAANAA
eukprot:CAMPEP_0176137064 /NCGR_PEP_ID=MMETSP0120_2-20121206/69575_1 /TAXON_ID=160619 /ORGANISM="Kryptoperidinium foliaceum, Strain CCMP 1326" /LENGTH=79 /DNA_ID=CAMNT_0017472883 /DNA_START=14 /DNA_END=249 /DNA_ORIENTATION=-